MVGEKKFKKISWIGLTVFVLLTAFLGYHLKDIRFDYNLENFFPSHDEETSFFFDYRDDFQSDNDFLLVSIENEAGIFNPEFLKKIDSFTKELTKVKNIESVRSITSESEQFIFPGGSTSSKPYIDFGDFDAKRDSIRIFKNNELINTFISENGKAICIFIKHEDYLSKIKGDHLVKDIDKITSELKIKNIRIAGRAVGQAYYINKMIFELSLFLGLSAFLIILFLYIAFK